MKVFAGDKKWLSRLDRIRHRDPRTVQELLTASEIGTNDINHSDLIEKVAEATELPKADAGRVVEAVVAALVEALKAGDEVRVSGLGTFDVVSRAARKGRNPQTGETLEIAASKAVRFRAEKSAKNALNTARPQSAERNSSTQKRAA